MTEKTNVENKEILHPEKIVILSLIRMPGWYPGDVRADEKETLSDKIRGDLALKNLKEANEIGYSMVLIHSPDDNPEFINALEGISDPNSKNKIIIKKQDGSTYSGSRRDAIRTAQEMSGCEVMVMVEMEKPIIKDIPDMVLPILNGQTDVTVTDRQLITHESISNDPEKPYENLRGMPRYQARSENWFNGWVMKFLKSQGIASQDSPKIDWMGNRAWKNTPKINSFFLAKYVKTKERYLEIDPDYLSSSLFFSLAAIFNEKSIKVVSVPVDYRHDEKQSALENNDLKFIEKRDRQRNLLKREMVEFVRMLKGKPNSLV
jgi:hypothetical protein